MFKVTGRARRCPLMADIGLCVANKCVLMTESEQWNLLGRLAALPFRS